MVSTGGLQETQSSESHVFRGQEPYLLDIYGRALHEVQQQTPGAYATAWQISGTYTPQLQSAVGSIAPQAANTGNVLNSIAYGTGAGQQTLDDLMSGGLNPHLDAMVNAAGQSVYRNLSRNILPSIQAGGNVVNPHGGGSTRSDIARGIAMSDANQQISEMAANLYGGAYDADQARRLSASQAYTNAQQSAAQQNLENYSALPELYTSGANALLNLGLSPYQQVWNQLLNYKQLVSDPAILNSFSKTRSENDFGIS